jgi:hypothetical protein
MTSSTTRFCGKGLEMTDNKILLDQALADQFTSLLGTARKSTVELATKAAAVRNQYLSVDGTRYAPEFHQFWKTYNMESKFGSLSTFTKYAGIGDAIEKVRARYEKYEAKLPTTMTALYEIAQLDDTELELCLEDHWGRTEITPDRGKWKRKGKKPAPLINPTVTAAVIKAWRKKWRNPQQPPTDKRRVSLAQIKIHSDLFEFKSGEHSEINSRELITQIAEALKEVMAHFNGSYVRLDLRDENLKAAYDKKEAVATAKAAAAAAKAAAAAEKKKQKDKRK